MRVDIIIPVYKPDKTFLQLIEKLENQTVSVNKIILMNTEEKYFQQLFYGSRFLKQYNNIDVYHLSKKEFNHGKTRRQGVKKSDADVFVMMTQDAMPKDEFLLENLLAALERESVAAAYARQLPDPKATPIEQYLREFNYPDEDKIKSSKDVETLGIKAYFCSDVCCAYKRSIYEELGGFVRHTIFNEDMIYAATAIKNGYEIAYAAKAQVVHSHNYTCMQQLHRNFDLGVSQADHPEVFANVPSEGEGIKSVKATAAYLKNQGLLKWIPSLIFQSGFKFVGYRLGKNYKKLSHSQIMKLTMNKEYWEQEARRKAVENIDATRGYGKSSEENN